MIVSRTNLGFPVLQWLAAFSFVVNILYVNDFTFVRLSIPDSFSQTLMPVNFPANSFISSRFPLLTL